jgi:hypothetical protein
MALEMGSKNFGRDITYEMWKQSNERFRPEGFKPVGSATKRYMIDNLKEYKALPKKGRIIPIEETRQNKLQWINKFGPEPTPIVSSSRDPMPTGGVSNSKFTTMRGKPIRFNKRVIQSPIRKGVGKFGGGVLGKLAMGATAMTSVISMNMKKMSYGGIIGRFLQDSAVGKNMINNSRLGLSVGTSRLRSNNINGATSLALGKLRHGRGAY